MDDLNDDLTKIPLTGDNLIEISSSLGKPKNKMAWVTYTSLSQFADLNALFKDGSIDVVFILITPPMETVGHWVTLGTNEHGLFYYDPYGLTIEEDIEITKADNALLMLLRGQMVDVNKFKHQKFGTDNGSEINTCGRHDAVRAYFSWMTNQEYNDKIIMPLVRNKEVNDPDTIVNLLTAFLSMGDDVVNKFLRSTPSKQLSPVTASDALNINIPLGGHSQSRSGVVMS